METTAGAPVTIVLATRDRGGSAAGAVRTILLNDYANFELIVVDQSDDNSTEESLKSAWSDGRVRYVRSATRGLAAARNVGIGHAGHEVIAFVDDDCETPRNWLREMMLAVEQDHRIGVVFGTVLPGGHDATAGFVPCYVSKAAFLARSIGEKHRAEGMGACMGVRRGTWEALGGFDEMLGAGAPFAAGDDTDFAVRALLAGYFVYETPDVVVIHHGFRTWQQGRTLIRRYWYGTGAVFAKQLKCGHWSVVALLLRLSARWLCGQSGVAASLGHPHRLLRLAAFLQGFATGAFTAVDRYRGHYKQGRRHERPPSGPIRV